MSYYCMFFGCDLYCPAHLRSMFARGEIWTYYIAYLDRYICMYCSVGMHKTQKYRDNDRLEPNYMPIESYIAVTYRDIFAIRGTHA